MKRPHRGEVIPSLPRYVDGLHGAGVGGFPPSGYVEASGSGMLAHAGLHSEDHLRNPNSLPTVSNAFL